MIDRSTDQILADASSDLRFNQSTRVNGVGNGQIFGSEGLRELNAMMMRKRH